MKCSDVDDQAFLDAVDEAARLRGFTSGATRWDIAAVLAGHPERVNAPLGDHDDELPQKLILAKARKLIRRGLLTGCWCGCRGDFEVPVATLDR